MPSFISGVREGRHTGLSGIVDQDIAASRPSLDGGGETGHGGLVEHVALLNQEPLVGRVVPKRSLERVLGRRKPRLVAATDGDRGALGKKQPRRGEPDT